MHKAAGEEAAAVWAVEPGCGEARRRLRWAEASAPAVSCGVELRCGDPVLVAAVGCGVELWRHQLFKPSASNSSKPTVQLGGVPG